MRNKANNKLNTQHSELGPKSSILRHSYVRTSSSAAGKSLEGLHSVCAADR
jgi:hypothetical protein